MATATGYRLEPHTADIAVTAWAGTEAGCLEQAVRGLVAAFAHVDETRSRRTRPVRLWGAAPQERLVAVLEEVVYLLDAEAVVPMHARVEVAGQQVRGQWTVVPWDEVEPVGPAPKAITWHGLGMEDVRGRWQCHVVVDV